MKVYLFRIKKLNAPLNIYSELETMLALRSLNWSYNDLADKFHVSRDTIIYLCRKFGLGGAKQPPIKHQRTTRAILKPIYDEPNDYSTKTYADYIRDEKERRWKKLTQSHIKPS